VSRHGKLAVTSLLSMGIFQARADKSFRFEITFYVVSRGYKNQRKVRFSMSNILDIMISVLYTQSRD